MYRSTPHSATGVSPFEAMRGGRRMCTRVDAKVIPNRCVDDDSIRNRVAVYQKGYTDRYNRRHKGVKMPTWEAGDLVPVRDPVSKVRVYGDVVRVERRTGPVSYLLSDGQRVHCTR